LCSTTRTATACRTLDDTPIGGVTLTLRGSAGVVMAVTTTNSTGFYEFSSGATMGTANGILPSTSYSIVIDLSSGPLVGYQATAARVGGNTQRDSNGEHVSRTFVESPAATGLLGTEDLSFDFGFVPVFEIGDFVWRDADGDGVQDAGETGIVGVTVTLQDAGGRTLRSAVTDAERPLPLPVGAARSRASRRDAGRLHRADFAVHCGDSHWRDSDRLQVVAAEPGRRMTISTRTRR
jgi:hypothetical protein